MKNDSTNYTTEKVAENTIIEGSMKPAVFAADAASGLNSTRMKYKPMLDDTILFRDETSVETKKHSIAQLIEKLNVIENLRYKRTVEDTYCNVYSFDYCHFNNVYLPTVWWTDEAIERLQAGEDVTPIYNDTVKTIYSSAITDWFVKWGPAFGWKRTMDVNELQEKVNNEGAIGIICAKRKIRGLSGHIVPVVPETAAHKAYREDGRVIYPLQSQAGKVNYKYFAKVKKDWWNNALYSSSVFYYHD
ncbi:hypothetical protein [Flavobacterium sp. 14A]|uniref:hypothetical protein n=1 Tax=Flavobacterium sp. 14A TaxID=2735896 RepID=UPI00156E2E84|nr:hypothetical protein [Flavobacterium sp. 14A]NRT12125.1 hypothetical protein [Flavobacterium sp. 14A]